MIGIWYKSPAEKNLTSLPRYLLKLFVPALLCLLLPQLSHAEPCKLDLDEETYKGTPLEQAQCLLRTVKPGGVVSGLPAVLPEFLQSWIGKPVGVTKEQMIAYLKLYKIADVEVGGDLHDAVSKTD